MDRASREFAAAAALSVAAMLVIHLASRRVEDDEKRERDPPPTGVAALPTYVISLARRPAKRRATMGRVREVGLRAATTFDAVDGRELDAEALRSRGVSPYSGWRLENSGNRFFDRDLKWGEIGCALSHHAIWKIVAEQHDLAIVLEDDVDFVPGFLMLLDAALCELEALVAQGVIEQPDAMYLARRPMRPELDQVLPPSGSDTPSVRLVKPGFSYKTTGYLLWRRGARKLLEGRLTSAIIPVDDFLALTYAEHASTPDRPRRDLDELFDHAPRLNMLAVRPQLCRERRGISDTENSRSCHR